MLRAGYCWPTPKYRNWYTQHAFFEGKKAEQTSPRKSTPRTLKGVGQQYPPVFCTSDMRQSATCKKCNKTQSINQCAVGWSCGSLSTAAWQPKGRRSQSGSSSQALLRRSWGAPIDSGAHRLHGSVHGSVRSHSSGAEGETRSAAGDRGSGGLPRALCQSWSAEETFLPVAW